MFRLERFCKGNAGADNNVCECEQRSAEDELHEDGRLLARVQPLHSLCRGSSSCVYGEWNYLMVFLKRFFERRQWGKTKTETR